MNNSLFPSLSPSSRLWIFLSDKKLSAETEAAIQNKLNSFCAALKGHGQPLKAEATILHKHFIILAVDETMNGAGGCSIDTIFHLMQQCEQEFSLSLLNRMLVSFRMNDEIAVMTLSEAKQNFLDGKISAETILFNTLCTSLGQFRNQFEQPVVESWLYKKFAPAVSH